MAKLSLTANPTFKAKVAIPIPGAEAVNVEFTFRHKTKKDLADHMLKLQNEATKKDDTTVVMEVATGWELEDEFNAENVETLLQNYHDAGRAIMETYGLQLIKGRQGN